MAETTTNYIEIDGEGKYIEDTDAREGVATNAAAIEEINAKIPSNASSSNKMLTAADRVSFTKTINIGRLTQSGWYSFGLITSSDIPKGNYLVSLRSSPDVQAQNYCCLLNISSQSFAMSIPYTTAKMISCSTVVEKGTTNNLPIQFYLANNSTVQGGDWVIRFDKVN